MANKVLMPRLWFNRCHIQGEVKISYKLLWSGSSPANFRTLLFTSLHYIAESRKAKLELAGNLSPQYLRNLAEAASQGFLRMLIS